MHINWLSGRTSRTSGHKQLSGRQSNLSSGKMHLIRESQKISVRVCKAEGP